MKIIIVGTAYPYRGGLSAFNERLAYEYLDRGDDVEIYTFTLQYPTFLFPGKTQYSDEPAPAGLVIHRRINSINPLNWVSVGREIARKRPDLLITKYWLPFMAPCLGSIERRVRRNGHTRIVSILDNVIPHEHRIGDRLFSRYFVGSTDRFVAMSRSVLDDLSLFDTKKPRRFCPHPLYDHYGDLIDKNLARQKLQIDPDGRYVLFFGFIRNYKGLDLLLDALADPRLGQRRVKLLVAGEFYGDPKPYMEQIQQLGISDRIVLCTDFIPDSQVNLYFRACDIVAQPYKSATQSGVTQIAFHFEKPMLVTNVGGLAEIVPDGKIGYVVEPDAKQIADALVRYYDGNCEAAFSAAVGEEKKKYTWDKMVDAIGTRD
ncbi:MAG: glycosyltransferase [Bacteroidaceae bacterium]|nr:glycosyltransferase [Bacteroidales bacterium]MBR0272588.1 glycosyltransferase [Bacteroidaceae bacterium]